MYNGFITFETSQVVQFPNTLLTKWVLAMGHEKNASGTSLFAICRRKRIQMGARSRGHRQGAEVPQTSLFLIGLRVFPIPHLVFPILYFVLPNDAKMEPK